MLLSYWNVLRVLISRALSVPVQEQKPRRKRLCRSRGMGCADEWQPSFTLSIQCEKTSHPFSWWVTVVSAVFPPTPKQGTGPSYGLGMFEYSVLTWPTVPEHHWRCCLSPTGLHCSHACLTIQPDIIYTTVMSRYPTRHHLQDINEGMPVMPALRRLRQENWYFRVVLSYITNSRLARVP